ncbi:thioredoxin family protein [Streptomyces gardneri]|uniref:thioredoxin family protein n=1 Tax=Nocardia TaxID=1817 RepID=UPI0013574588|nr:MULTISPECIES: thioredoxin family protein [Nocardia]MBF6165377.1 thioredoxin family protein [Streptomyces gardneri]UAK34456.1 thioredoxin family protein [Nocardia asteroides]
MIQITILAVALLAALAVGVLLRRREGKVRAAESIEVSDSARAELLAAVGVTGAGPAVLHFSAEWCGPCDAVRRVVANVADQLAGSPQPPQDIEVDIDAEPALARELNVLSLPTTFVFDVEGRERFRISGVPKVTDLHSALEPLTAAA